MGALRSFGRTLAHAAGAPVMRGGTPLNPDFVTDVSPLFGTSTRGGWFPVIEAFGGAWQQNIVIPHETMLAFTAVYACVTRISRDLGKMPLCLKEQKKGSRIWTKIDRNNPYLPVLAKPNSWQTRSQFIQQWTISKLLAGNAYILKSVDGRGVTNAMYVLNPVRVRPMIAPDGEIFYDLAADPLQDVPISLRGVPARAIIHDRMPALFHPLVGTSPIFACALAAMQGHHTQRSMASLFRNLGMPAGMLVTPDAISKEKAKELKDSWDENFGGHKTGNVAILTNGLKFEPLTIKPVDAQLIEQLKWTSATVCSAFDVPPYMVGIEPQPATTNIEAIAQKYLQDCLQGHIEDIESSLGEGLGLANSTAPDPIRVELDTSVLLRMDTATRYKTWKDGVSGSFLAPNEARENEDLPPVKGGDSPLSQVQNYSLEALSKRDTAPQAKGGTDPPPAAGATDPSGGQGDGETDYSDTAKGFLEALAA